MEHGERPFNGKKGANKKKNKQERPYQPEAVSSNLASYVVTKSASSSSIPRFSLIALQVLTGAGMIVIAWLAQRVNKDGSDDAMRAALAVVIFLVSTWGFVTLSLEARRRRLERERGTATRYQGVFKRFSDKNGWGLVGVPGHHDVRIYREIRDEMNLALQEACDFLVEEDDFFPGWFKAVDVQRIINGNGSTNGHANRNGKAVDGDDGDHDGAADLGDSGDEMMPMDDSAERAGPRQRKNRSAAEPEGGSSNSVEADVKAKAEAVAHAQKEVAEAKANAAAALRAKIEAEDAAQSQKPQTIVPSDGDRGFADSDEVLPNRDEWTEVVPKKKKGMQNKPFDWAVVIDREETPNGKNNAEQPDAEVETLRQLMDKRMDGLSKLVSGGHDGLPTLTGQERQPLAEALKHAEVLRAAEDATEEQYKQVISAMEGAMSRLQLDALASSLLV